MVIQAVTYSFLQIVIGGNASTAMTDAYPSTPDEGLNVLVLILNGGWAMVPIFGLLLFALYSFISRYFSIAKASRNNETLMQNIGAAIQKSNIDDALQICSLYDTPSAKMAEKGILRIGRPLGDINTAIDNAGRLEIIKLENFVPRFVNIAVLSVLIGLLGTFMGLIQVFYDMPGAMGTKNSVSDALVPTVAGLAVAVVAYCGFIILNSKVKNAALRVASCQNEFMDILIEPVR